MEAEDLMADAPLILQHLVRADSSAVFAEHNQIGAARLSLERNRQGSALARGLRQSLTADVRHDYLRACGEAVVERDGLAVAVVANRAIFGCGAGGDACLSACAGRPAECEGMLA